MSWGELEKADDVPLSAPHYFHDDTVPCMTVGELARRRRALETAILDRIVDDIERHDLCQHFKNDRRYTATLLGRVVREAYLEKARGGSHSGNRVKLAMGETISRKDVSALEAAVASRREVVVPEILCEAISNGAGVLFLRDNYIPKSKNILLRMMQSPVGEKSKNALATGRQAARSYILDLRVLRDDGSRLLCDGRQNKELLEQRPAGVPFSAERVKEVLNNDDFWTFVPACRFPLSPFVSREAAISRGVPALGVRAGDLDWARLCAAKGWVDRTGLARMTRMVMGSNILSSSASHADFRQKSMGVEVRPNLAALEEEWRTVFETVDTEYVMHMIKLRWAIKEESNVVAGELKRFVAHVAQTPMIMHMEKGLQERLFADPTALLIAIAPEMIEGYKHKTDVMKKVVKTLMAVLEG